MLSYFRRHKFKDFRGVFILEKARRRETSTRRIRCSAIRWESRVSRNDAIGRKTQSSSSHARYWWWLYWFIFLNADSPRTTDLLVKPDFSLHCFMNDSSGSSGEFQVNGRARKIEDAALRSLAESFSNFRPATSSNLFELLITDALSTIYRGGRPLRDRWAADKKEQKKRKS